MFITGLGTADPRLRHTQRLGWDAIRPSPGRAAHSSRSHAILRKVLTGNNGIEARHLALDPLSEVFEFTPNAMHARFKRVAPQTGGEAARLALAESGRRPEEIGSLVVAACTVYLCPGLSSYIGERLGLPRNAQLLDLVGLGCGAAVPTLRTLHVPEAREKLRFDSRAGLLRNILAPDVPVLSAGFAVDVLDRAEIAPPEISEWLFHSGGRDVLREITERIGLNERAVRHSTEVLREYGNMSSPSCLFSLRRALDENADGGKWWLASFGAGFSSQGALLEVR